MKQIITQKKHIGRKMDTPTGGKKSATLLSDSLRAAPAPRSTSPSAK